MAMATSKIAVYRKYRPRYFNDILGQEITVKILKEAARQDKIFHAYLLAGPRGTGKTTTARLIAKTANCLKRQKDGEPCNECEICVEINKGSNLDIVEIDAASNRGIDEIRNLRENVRIAPSKSKYKVFIIDEAHMLTKDAFNALLKTLEEPPEHAIFVLATTEIEKVPPTIASRTQQFYFKKASVREIVGKLRQIAQDEKVEASPEAIELIASSAEGSFRDAESLFDQIIASGVKTINANIVEEMVGKVGFSKLSEVAASILQKDLDNTLKLISEIEDGGYNLVQFTKDLIQYLRRTAVLKFSPAMENLLERELTGDNLKKLKEHANLFEEKHLVLMKELINAYSQMRYSQFPIIPLEIAIIEHIK